MSDTTPTVTSNSQAAQLAMQTERNRVMSLLALANGVVPEPIMRAIEAGTPAAVFATAQRMHGTKAANEIGAPGVPRPSASASKWSGVTARLNAQRSRSLGGTDESEVGE